jgi:hypothetical protein
METLGRQLKSRPPVLPSILRIGKMTLAAAVKWISGPDPKKRLEADGNCVIIRRLF